MMKRSFRDAWTAKLRSGEFTQTRSSLAKAHDNSCRCCLGVAYAVEDRLPRYSYEFEEFYGMPTSEDLTGWGLTGRQAQILARRNDLGDTFAQIADYIDTLPVEEG